MIGSSVFVLPGKKRLLQPQAPPQAVAMDVTESPRERPGRTQRSFYSGKNLRLELRSKAKRHTFKSLLVVDVSDRQIICMAHGKGQRHDFKVFSASGIHFHAPKLRD